MLMTLAAGGAYVQGHQLGEPAGPVAVQSGRWVLVSGQAGRKGGREGATKAEDVIRRPPEVLVPRTSSPCHLAQLAAQINVASSPQVSCLWCLPPPALLWSRSRQQSWRSNTDEGGRGVPHPKSLVLSRLELEEAEQLLHDLERER